MDPNLFKDGKYQKEYLMEGKDFQLAQDSRVVEVIPMVPTDSVRLRRFWRDYWRRLSDGEKAKIMKETIIGDSLLPQEKSENLSVETILDISDKTFYETDFDRSFAESLLEDYDNGIPPDKQWWPEEEFVETTVKIDPFILDKPFEAPEIEETWTIGPKGTGPSLAEIHSWKAKGKATEAARAQHYNAIVGDLQYVQVMAYITRGMDPTEAHCVSSAMKYQLRNGKKANNDKIQEVTKAIRWLEILIKWYESGMDPAKFDMPDSLK